MDSKPEDFNRLRRLLALKRHEQPPPGYFHDFSREVIASLRAGGTGEGTFWERLHEEAPWLGRLLESFSVRPLWSGAVGAAACALIIGGVMWVQNTGLNGVDQAKAVHPAFILPEEQRAAFVFNSPLAQPQTVSLTNASDQPNIPASLFDNPINPQPAAHPASPLFQR